ncbi:MAG: hypothetical protein ACE5HP_05235 [Gemmatimonadota bacterium]
MRADPRTFRASLPIPRAGTAAGVLGLLLLFGLLPSPLEAQRRAKLIPQVGLFRPLRGLGRVQDSGGETLRLGTHESSLAWGIGVEFGGETPVGVRGSVLWGTSADIPVRGPGGATSQTQGTVRVVTGTLVFRPFRSYVGARPYVLAGGGIKRHGLDDGDLNDLDIKDAVDDQTNGTLQLGGGVSFSIGVTQVLLEISDFISTFDVKEGKGDGKTQHDLFLTVGLRL